MFHLVLFVVLRQSHEEVLLHVFKMTSSASLSLNVKGAAPFTSKRLGLVAHNLACTVYQCVFVRRGDHSLRTKQKRGLIHNPLFPHSRALTRTRPPLISPE